jgi:ATP-dependent helicase HrpB
LDDWLPALVTGCRRLSDVPTDALATALDDLLGWDGRQQLDRAAPRHFTTPLGSTHAIDYAAPAGPTVSLRVQALFGQDRHPTVGDTPLVLELLSPAGRAIQVTRDLPGFWKGSWATVAKEMRGRYPRHPWPDDPAAAAPTLRTKRAATS